MKEKARQRAQQKQPLPSAEDENPITEGTTTTTTSTTSKPSTKRGKFPTRVPSFKRPRPLRWKELAGIESTTESSAVRTEPELTEPVESSTKPNRFARPNRFRPTTEEPQLDPVESTTKFTRFVRPNRFRPKTEKPLLPDIPEPELEPTEAATKPTRFVRPNRFRPKTESSEKETQPELEPEYESSSQPPEQSDFVPEWPEQPSTVTNSDHDQWNDDEEALPEPPSPPLESPESPDPKSSETAADQPPAPAVTEEEPIEADPKDQELDLSGIIHQPNPAEDEPNLNEAVDPHATSDELDIIPEELEELQEPNWDQNNNRRSSHQTFQMVTDDPMLPIEELWNIRIRDDGKGMWWSSWCSLQLWSDYLLF